MSTPSTDKGGHCKLPVQPGRIEKRSDGNRSRRDAWDFYFVEGVAGLETTVGRQTLDLGLFLHRFVGWTLRQRGLRVKSDLLVERAPNRVRLVIGNLSRTDEGALSEELLLS
jgi:hypothetical protein